MHWTNGHIGLVLFSWLACQSIVLEAWVHGWTGERIGSCCRFRIPLDFLLFVYRIHNGDLVAGFLVTYQIVLMTETVTGL